MKVTALSVMFTFMFALILSPTLSDARCRTVGESASLGTEMGTFPLYPAERLVQIGQQRDNPVLMWVGYVIGVPLFVPAAATAILGAGSGALSHPWTKCIQTEEQRMPEIQAVRALTKTGP
ncbi:MAG TPA: hypothetical protein VN666_21035 [Nitrospira sp.]|nr:hypothetical protein [Nitrospira sp.]